MRAFTLITLALLLAFSTASAGRHNHFAYTIDCDEDDAPCEIDIRHGTVVIEDCGYDYCRVEITEDSELYINGEHIETDPDQQKLLREFYEHVEAMEDYAKELGWEGAKIGVAGAKLGLMAIGKVVKLLSPRYDTDDLEREMEDEAEKLEERAEELEEKAEEIDDRLEELEDLAYDLNKAIPELDAYDWF